MLGLAILVPSTILVPSVADAANNTATVERVGGDIRYLASDELEGRGPGTAGLEKAAEYIRDEFKRLGLKSGVKDGSYFQPFDLVIDTKPVLEKTSLVLRGPEGQELKLDLGKQFQALATGGSGKAKADVVFAGYGISAPKMKYDDYADSDVEGKVVVIIRREPQQGQAKSAFDGKKTTPHSFIRTKIDAAKKAKAAAVLLVNDPFNTQGEGKKDTLTAPTAFGTGSLGLPFAHVSQEVVNQLLKASPVKSGDDELGDLQAVEAKIDETFEPMTQPLAGWTAELQFEFEKVRDEVSNIIGVLEGEGPLANETVVIGAHYDHLGYGPFGSRRPNVRAIHNGADDNATGTSAVMELARRFAQRDKKPARRMVFIAFTAEERGIIGSNYYVENPVIPLKDTVAMINFDMIGGLKDTGLLLGGIKTAKQFAAVVERATADGVLKINTSGPLGGSDHSAFYRKEIPVFFMFTGMTDLYHTPEDDFETINVEGVVKTVDFAEKLISEVVSMPKRPQYVKRAATPRGTGGMAYLGVVPDYAGTGDGLRITDVNADSPAAKGGMKTGDVIIKFGDVTVADIEGLAAGLRKYKAGKKIKIVVKRGKEEKSLDVTLGRPRRAN